MRPWTKIEYNYRYVEVNSGTDCRIKTSAGIHAINPEECDVYSSLLDGCSSGVITPGGFSFYHVNIVQVSFSCTCVN
jgi:hypothetical protein